MKRKIFYIPGFDPRSETYYKRLLLAQFAEIKPNIRTQSTTQVVYQAAGLTVDYEILSWHTSVKKYWSQGVKANALDIFTLFSEFVFKGTWQRLFRLSRRDALQKAFSVYFLSLSFLLSLVSLTMGYLWVDKALEPLLLLFVAWLALNGTLYWVLKKLNLFWITRIKGFFVRYARREVPDVMAFEQQAMKRVLACLAGEEFDEVVLVAHSVGTILCLDMLADCEDPLLSKLKVVTLGHCVTGVSILESADWFNQKLAHLAHRRFFWVNVTSGKDAVNFHKVSPAYDQRIQPDVALSAQFHRLFDPVYYQSLRWQFYQVHFLYLSRPDFADKTQWNFARLLFDLTLFSSLKNTHYHEIKLE